MTTFYNPYQFVKAHGSINGKSSAKKSYQSIKEGKSHIRHDSWGKNTMSGEIVCTVTTKSPMFIGAYNNNQPSNNIAKPVPHYERKINGKLEPAIPANSLRGMIGQTFETLSQSTLRVLENKVLSVRKGMNASHEFFYGMGMIKKNDKGDEENAFSILPLCVGTQLERSREGVTVASGLPWLSLFKGRRLSHCLPAYIDGYNKFAGRIGDLNSLDPFAYPNPNEHTFFYAKLHDCLGRAKVGDNFFWSNEMINAVEIPEYGNSLIAQKYKEIINAETYEKISTQEEKNQYTRGVIRILDRDNYPDIPATKKREWFIPYPEEIENDTESLAIPQSVIDTYNELAAESFKRGADKKLPVTLRGYDNADVAENRLFLFGCDSQVLVEEKKEEEPESKVIKGDLFAAMMAAANSEKPKEKPPEEKRIYTVSEISLSVIWRKRLPKKLYDYFPSNDDQLTPWRDEEQQDRPRNLTPAETLMGFVSDGTVEGSKTASALASRIKISDGLLASSQGEKNAYEKVSYILKILASPKTPSPSMYFHHPDEPYDFVNKTALNPNKHQANGYKYYLHHPRAVKGSQDHRPWQTQQPQKSLKQKISICPVQRDTTFNFSISFDNLKPEELDLLLTVMNPGEACLHHLGMGKPIGLGSIKLDIAGVYLVNRSQRYKADQLFSPRYAEAWIAESDNHEQSIILAEANREKRKQVSTQKDFKSARSALHASIDSEKSLVDQVTLKVLNELMNPAAVPDNMLIHYPITENQKVADEDKGFEWFVNNDKPQNHDKQALGYVTNTIKPLNKNNGHKNGKK